MVKRKDLPVSVVKQIFHDLGAERVSTIAAERFTDKIIDCAKYHARRISLITRHAGRKTVSEDDIDLEPEMPSNKAKKVQFDRKFPLSPFRDFLKASGGAGTGGLNAGKDVADKFRKYIIMEKTLPQVDKAIKLAAHAKRVTVKPDDIDMIKFT